MVRGSGGSESALVPPVRAKVAALQREQPASEVGALADALSLLWGAGRGACSGERWLTLARALRSSAMLRGGGSAEPGSLQPLQHVRVRLVSPVGRRLFADDIQMCTLPLACIHVPGQARTAEKFSWRNLFDAQVVLLLISALDLEKMLSIVASGEPQPERSAHALADADAMAGIDRELRGWWEGTPPRSLTPLLLAWAAFVALANMLKSGGVTPPARCIGKLCGLMDDHLWAAGSQEPLPCPPVVRVV